MSFETKRLERAHEKCLTLAELAPPDYCIEVTSSEHWELELFTPSFPVKHLRNQRVAEILRDLAEVLGPPPIEDDWMPAFLMFLSGAAEILKSQPPDARREATPMEWWAIQVYREFFESESLEPRFGDDLITQLARKEEIADIARRFRQMLAQMIEFSRADFLARRCTIVDSCTAIGIKTTRRFIIYFDGQPPRLTNNEFLARMRRLSDVATVVSSATTQGELADGDSQLAQLLSLLFERVGWDREVKSKDFSARKLRMPVCYAAARLIEVLNEPPSNPRHGAKRDPSTGSAPPGGSNDESTLDSTVTELETILFYGDGGVSVPGCAPFSLTENERAVLESFIDKPAMDTNTLREYSGCERPAEVLRKLTSKYDALLSPYIFLPGGKGKGGYAVRIRRAKPPE